MERYWLFAAAICFLLSFGHMLFALGRGTFRPARFNPATMAGGFAAESVCLYFPPARRIAVGPIAILLLALITLPGIRHLSMPQAP